MKILVIAPTYKNYNHRENRLLKYLEKKEKCYELLVDREIYKVFTWSQYQSVIRHKNKINQLNDGDYIIITDPGLIGLFIAKLNKNKKVKVIFDYHDLLSWEVFYQVKKKLGINLISKLVFKTSLFVIGKLLSRSKVINFLIAISDKQIQETSNHIKWLNKVDHVIVPNVRPHIDQNFTNNTFSSVDIIWMGNIQRGRDLEGIVKLLTKCNNEEIQLNLFGNILDEEFFKELKENDNIKYFGTYESDLEILEKLNQNFAIGIFLGWDDIFNTNINQLGSPNKVFSYINMGIPVLLSSNLETLKK